MKSIANSINQNGCSVCQKGEENYTTFRIAHRPFRRFYQYDYRHKDGELFSTVAPTLEQCRSKRNKWVQGKNYQRIFPFILGKIQKKQRLTVDDMSYQIGAIKPAHIMANMADCFSRDEILTVFNSMFGTDIK
jgi:hypothetical protein